MNTIRIEQFFKDHPEYDFQVMSEPKNRHTLILITYNPDPIHRYILIDISMIEQFGNLKNILNDICKSLIPQYSKGEPI